MENETASQIGDSLGGFASSAAENDETAPYPGGTCRRNPPQHRGAPAAETGLQTSSLRSTLLRS